MLGVVRGRDSGDELSDKSVRKEVLFWFSGFKFRVMGLTVGSGVLGRVRGSRLSSLDRAAGFSVVDMSSAGFVYSCVMGLFLVLFRAAGKVCSGLF